MLLQRMAKIGLQQRISAYLARKEFDKLPAKNIAKPRTEKELCDDIFFYAGYALERAANMNEEFQKVLKEIIAQKKTMKDVQLKEILEAIEKIK